MLAVPASVQLALERLRHSVCCLSGSPLALPPCPAALAQPPSHHPCCFPRLLQTPAEAGKAGKAGAEAGDACCGSGHRRLDRSAMKQHLDELHMT